MGKLENVSMEFPKKCKTVKDCRNCPPPFYGNQHSTCAAILAAEVDDLRLEAMARQKRIETLEKFEKRFIEIMKSCSYYPDTSSERKALADLAQEMEG